MMTSRITPLARLLAALAVLALPTSALADTWYVATDGADGATGGDADPFATIQRAADAAQPGDEVLVREGSYAGFVPPRGGTSAAPIVYRAVGDVVIDQVCSGCDGHGVNLRDPDSPRGFITIEGFTIRGMPRRGIGLSWTTGVIIRGCAVTRSGGENIYGGHANDAIVEDNEVADGDGHGIYFANSSERPTIRRNHIHDNGSAGIHFNGDVRFPPGDGVIRGAVIDANHIHDNGSNGINWDGVQDSVVSNNFIHGNGLNGIRAFGPPNSAADSSEGPRNDLFVNNTILVPPGAGWCIRITDDLGDNVAFNNVLIAESSGGSLALDGTMGFASGHNLVEGRLTLDRGDTILSLAEWQAAGYGQNSATATAAELFAAAADPHLRAGSAGVDRGAARFAGRDAPLVDLDGEARPAGAGFDVGADEHGSTPAGDAGPPAASDGGVAPGPDGGSVDAGPRERPDAGDGGARDPVLEGGGGCGCRVGAPRSSSPPGGWWLLAAGALSRRRRSRGR